MAIKLRAGENGCHFPDYIFLCFDSIFIDICSHGSNGLSPLVFFTIYTPVCHQLTYASLSDWGIFLLVPIITNDIMTWKPVSMALVRGTFYAPLALCEGKPPVIIDLAHKGHGCRALMFSLLLVSSTSWVAGDFRCHRCQNLLPVKNIEIDKKEHLLALILKIVLNISTTYLCKYSILAQHIYVSTLICTFLSWRLLRPNPYVAMQVQYKRLLGFSAMTFWPRLTMKASLYWTMPYVLHDT